MVEEGATRKSSTAVATPVPANTAQPCAKGLGVSVDESVRSKSATIQLDAADDYEAP